MRVLLSIAALAVGLSACSGPRYPSEGTVAPTVSGAPSASFDDLARAKAAFSRTNGPLTATLEDAAWIRLEPDPEQAEERHPDYAAGLTTFEVLLQTEGFVRPTEELYVLTDSLGQSLTSKPTRYRGSTEMGGRPQVAAFSLSFRHVVTKDVKWLRLTRQGAGGGTVQWDFR
jgi:hypothetical protein